MFIFIFGINLIKGAAPIVCINVCNRSTKIPVLFSAPEASNARNAGIEIYAVGTGQSPNEVQLNLIGTQPAATHVFTQLRTDADVSRLGDKVLDGICQ